MALLSHRSITTDMQPEPFAGQYVCLSVYEWQETVTLHPQKIMPMPSAGHHLNVFISICLALLSAWHRHDKSSSSSFDEHCMSIEHYLSVRPSVCLSLSLFCVCLCLPVCEWQETVTLLPQT